MSAREAVFPQRSPEWYDFRKRHITATDLVSLLDMNPWSTNGVNAVVQSKVNPPDEKPTPAMQYGIDHESEAIEHFSGMLPDNLWLQPARLCFRPGSLLAASPDSFIVDTKDDRPTGVFEIKCKTSSFTVPRTLADVPLYHIMQVAAQMRCTGLLTGWIGYFSEGTTTMYDVSTDAQVLIELIDRPWVQARIQKVAAMLEEAGLGNDGRMWRWGQTMNRVRIQGEGPPVWRRDAEAESSQC